MGTVDDRHVACVLCISWDDEDLLDRLAVNHVELDVCGTTGEALRKKVHRVTHLLSTDSPRPVHSFTFTDEIP